VINISITDEARAPDLRSSWHTTSNRYLEEPIDFGFPNGEAAFIGKACGKALHISDTPARKAKASVQAMITIMSAAGELSGSTGPRPVIGTFESKPITIVSKPSKKRQNTKNSEREQVQAVLYCLSYSLKLAHALSPRQSFCNTERPYHCTTAFDHRRVRPSSSRWRPISHGIWARTARRSRPIPV
jgi:hypothetical protein